VSRARVRTTTGAMPAPVRQPSPRVGARPLAPTVRSTAMLLLNEELARARTRDREAEAVQARLALRVRAARRSRRRAESAARRARLTAAATV
jgi:hypothetical protein